MANRRTCAVIGGGTMGADIALTLARAGCPTHLVETFANVRRLRHHGETRGFTNIAYRFPARQLTIVVLTNRSDSAPWERADRIATALLDGE